MITITLAVPSGKVLVELPAIVAQGLTQSDLQGLSITIIWDTGAVKSSSPTKKVLTKLKELQNVVLQGINGTQRLKFKGTYYPNYFSTRVAVPCLWVPGSPYIILSISDITKLLGAHAYFNEDEAYLWNGSHGVIATATCKSGLYFQDLKVPTVTVDWVLKRILATGKQKRQSKTQFVMTYAFSLEHLKQLHDAANHKAFSTIRKIYGFPPADPDNPDPLCTSCAEAEMPRGKIPQSSREDATRPGQIWMMDLSRKMPTDRRGYQRFGFAACMYSDAWVPFFVKRKSDAVAEVEKMINTINNRQAPHRITTIVTDGESVLNSEEFKEMLERNSIFLRISPPNDQAKNPAENVMRRAQKAMKAIMFRSSMVKSSWSYAINHVAWTHNALPRTTRPPPHQDMTGIKPSWKPDIPFGCKVLARLYNKGKLDRAAVECVYLGRDTHCNADIVRPYNSRLASGIERYASVTKADPQVFPYTYPTVPRPRPYQEVYYDSDSENEEEDEGEVYNASTADLLAKSKNASHRTQTELEAKRKTVLPDSTAVQDMVREGLKQRIRAPTPAALNNIVDQADQDARRAKRSSARLSAQAQHNATQLSALAKVRYETMIQKVLEGDTPTEDDCKYFYSYLNETYEVDDPNDADKFNIDNPYYHLFDPANEAKWQDPKTLRAVYAHRMKEYFLEAMHKEQEAWRRNKVYTIILRDDIPINEKTGKKYSVMNCSPVWKTKYNRHDNTVEKFKYRLCVNGSKQDKSKAITYEPMVAAPSLKTFFDMVVRFDMDYLKTDASEYFLNFEVRPDEQYYMNLPPGWHPELDRSKYACRVNKAVYGIPSATQTAGRALHKHLTHVMGFTASVHDPRVYSKWHSDTDLSVIMVHVDDCLHASTKESYLDDTVRQLNNFVTLTVEKRPKVFKGIEITDSAYVDNVTEGRSAAAHRVIKLSQKAYIEEMYDKLQLEEKDRTFKKVPMPKIPSEWDYEPEVQATQEQISRYLEIQGTLQWCMTTVPSANFAVNWLSRFMRNPQQRHFDIQRQCLDYILSISRKGIVFAREGPPHRLTKGYKYDDLEGAADSTWMDRQKHPKAYSTTGFVFRTAMGTLHWATKRQNNVTNSSCEAEVMANRSCCQQGIWLRGFLTDLGFSFSGPTIIHQDNQSAMHIAQNDGQQKNTRHFRVACAYLRELTERRHFTFNWVASSEMYADILTKPLDERTHAYHEATLVNNKTTQWHV